MHDHQRVSKDTSCRVREKKSETEEGFEDRNVCFIAIAVLSAIAIRDRSQSAN
jgi:hypothetical protein